MPVWKKNNIPVTGRDAVRSTLVLPILMLCLPVISIAETAPAPAIIIESVTGATEEGVYNINASISFNISDESRVALEHGIPLEFDTELQLLRPRAWLWDKLISASSISYRVEHQPLSGHYLVTRLNTGNRNQFQSLTGALDFIGRVKNYPLTESSRLTGGNGYYVRMRTRLNIETLPAPLRPLAYLSPQWRMSSAWQSWSITK